MYHLQTKHYQEHETKRQNINNANSVLQLYNMATQVQVSHFADCEHRISFFLSNKFCG